MGLCAPRTAGEAAREGAHALAELRLVPSGQLLEVRVQVGRQEGTLVPPGRPLQIEQDVVLHRPCMYAQLLVRTSHSDKRA